MTYDHWKTTNPADAELGNVEPRPTIVERYRGFDIYRDETGFGWQESDGLETIAECRADIDACLRIARRLADRIVAEQTYVHEPYRG